jgi:sulfotransferase 6B1
MRASQAVARNRVLRRLAIPTYRAYSRVRYRYPPPRVLANGVPKGGTHLLTTLLGAYPQMRFSGITATLSSYRTTPMGRPNFERDDVDWVALRHGLDRVPEGQFLMAHFPYVAGLGGMLDEMGYRHVLIIRDPRDVVVSDAVYMSTYPRHRHYARFHALNDPQAAIMLVIAGFRNDDGTVGLESIGERMANYAAWQADRNALVCRFEDLVGVNGGGSRRAQVEVVQQIGTHICRELTPASLERVTARVWSPSSHTFRTGRSGGWREAFTTEHHRLFDDVAGEWLIRLGYAAAPDGSTESPASSAECESLDNG